MGACPESVLTNVSSQIVEGDICIIYVPESRFFLGGRAKSIAAIQGETSAAMKSDFTCKAVFSWWKGQANCSHIRTRGKNCSHEFGLNLQGKLWRGTDVSYMCPNRCFFLVEGPSQLQQHLGKRETAAMNSDLICKSVLTRS